MVDLGREDGLSFLERRLKGGKGCRLESPEFSLNKETTRAHPALNESDYLVSSKFIINTAQVTLVNTKIHEL